MFRKLSGQLKANSISKVVVSVFFTSACAGCPFIMLRPEARQRLLVVARHQFARGVSVPVRGEESRVVAVSKPLVQQRNRVVVLPLSVIQLL